MDDPLHFQDETLHSRLFIGTGKFSNIETMIAAVKASGTDLVTVALRRLIRHRPKTISTAHSPSSIMSDSCPIPRVQ